MSKSGFHSNLIIKHFNDEFAPSDQSRHFLSHTRAETQMTFCVTQRFLIMVQIIWQKVMTLFCTMSASVMLQLSYSGQVDFKSSGVLSLEKSFLANSCLDTPTSFATARHGLCMRPFNGDGHCRAQVLMLHSYPFSHYCYRVLSDPLGRSETTRGCHACVHAVASNESMRAFLEKPVQYCEKKSEQTMWGVSSQMQTHRAKLISAPYAATTRLHKQRRCSWWHALKNGSIWKS